MKNLAQALTLILLLAILSPQASGAGSLVTTATTTELLKQCNEEKTTAEIHNCLPPLLKKTEQQLKEAETKERTDMMALEDASEGSRHVRPVNAFDKAAKAYRYFRDAECRRINTSYGSGNGGGLAELNCLIEMNIKRATQLNHTNQSK